MLDDRTTLGKQVRFSYWLREKVICKDEVKSFSC